MKSVVNQEKPFRLCLGLLRRCLPTLAYPLQNALAVLFVRQHPPFSHWPSPAYLVQLELRDLDFRGVDGDGDGLAL